MEAQTDPTMENVLTIKTEASESEIQYTDDEEDCQEEVLLNAPEIMFDNQNDERRQQEKEGYLKRTDSYKKSNVNSDRVEGFTINVADEPPTKRFKGKLIKSIKMYCFYIVTVSMYSFQMRWLINIWRKN